MKPYQNDPAHRYSVQRVEGSGWTMVGTYALKRDADAERDYLVNMMGVRAQVFART